MSAPAPSPAVARVLDALGARGLPVRRSGSGWMARCPAHDDRVPSLKIDQGADRALIFCHAGCAAADVVATLGLEPRDLFDDPVPARGYRRVPARQRPRRAPPKPQQPFRVLPLCEFIKVALEAQPGEYTERGSDGVMRRYVDQDGGRIFLGVVGRGAWPKAAA